jgi:hypothetical protein
MESFISVAEGPHAKHIELMMNCTPTKYRLYGRASALICALAASVLVMAACATQNRGGLKHSPEVAQAFETYHVFEDHRYYYLNQENKPYAVVAVKNSYRIDSVMWREFDPQSGKLEKIVDLVKEFSGVSSYTYGSYIQDAQGNSVGYWYSKLRMTSVNVDHESRLISLYTQTPWLRDDDRVYGPGIGIGVGSGGSGVGIRF